MDSLEIEYRKDLKKMKTIDRIFDFFMGVWFGLFIALLILLN